MDKMSLIVKKQSENVFWRRFKDSVIERFFQFNGLLAVIILLGIFSLLFIEGFPAFKELGLGEFFLNSRWDPTSPERESYGILAMVVSTLMVTLGAMVIAVPVGIACAAYIADVAALEWQWNSALNAAEAQPLVAEDLAALPAEELAEHCLRPHPSTRFVTSTYPIQQIWDMHQDGADPDAGVDLDDGGDALLIVRPYADVMIHSLSPNAFVFASRLANGATIGEAFGALDGIETPENLSVYFAKLIAAGMFEKIQ